MTGWITDWSGGVPDGWASWEPGQAVGSAEGVAERLADGDAARERVRAAVLGIDADLPLERALLSAAVWVPDPSSGEPLAMLLAELAIPTERGVPVGFEGYLRAAAAPPPWRFGRKVFEHSVTTVEVPVGRAVLERLVMAERREPVTTAVTFTIFPDGTDEAIRLTLSSLVPAAADVLLEQGHSMAEAVTATIEPGERP